MKDLRNAEQAGHWLQVRLKKLEGSTMEAVDVVRLVGDGGREVTADLESNPLLFIRDAMDRLRRYVNRCRQTAFEELRRRGFQVEALERSAVGMVAEDAGRAVAVLTGLVSTLRQRLESLGAEGTQRYEQGHQRFESALREMGKVVQSAQVSWEREGGGRRRFWQFRRRPKDPTQDHRFLLEVNAGVQRLSGDLQAALGDVGHGALQLSIAKYYSDMVNHLSLLMSAIRELGGKARLAHSAAERRWLDLTRAKRGDEGQLSSSLLDGGTLDSVLEALGIDAGHFLQKSHLSFLDLASLPLDELQEVLRAWVEQELSHLANPSLAEVLSGFGDETALLRRILDLLYRAQPLMSYNDDLAMRFAEGQRAQTFAIAYSEDPTTMQVLGEACDQLGYPSPLAEHLDDEANTQTVMRVMLFAAGLPFFTQIDRLRGMLETHQQVMSGQCEMVTQPEVLVGLRDMAQTLELPELIPESLLPTGMREARAKQAQAQVSVPAEAGAQGEGAAPSAVAEAEEEASVKPKKRSPVRKRRVAKPKEVSDEGREG